MIGSRRTSPPRREPAPGRGQDLAAGTAGLALLAVEYARTGLGGREAARRWAAAMTRDPVTAHPDACGLYRGAPAVAFVLHTAADPAYAAALRVLDDAVAAVTRHRLARAHDRIDRGGFPALREFDLIRGLTGLGVYLLLRHGGGDLLRDVLGYLVRLTEPRRAGGVTLPGWWTRHGPGDRPAPGWPGGHANLGMAHGIAGPLALLAKAARRGVTVPGQHAAIDRICATLDRWRRGDPARPWWPETVSHAEWRARAVRQAGPARPSWCYGTPGLARAQQLAGLALGDAARRELAERALLACITDERRLALLRDASLCHGWAGLVQATRRMAAAAPGTGLASRLPHLLSRMDDHLHRHGPPSPAGLLEGRTGVRLARYAIPAPASRWDACLLLDD